MKHSQKNILPHSQAKLDLYQKYIEKYFSILGLAKGITKINIFDLFCGTGIYEDGKEGSPILAFNKVKEVYNFFFKKGWPLKPIEILVNDEDKNKINNVEEYLTKLNKPEICKLRFYSSDVKILLPQIIREINNQSKQERNLLFIDPYGYKSIDPLEINALLTNKRTEIILFLPVSFMHRFKNVSLVAENLCYQALYDFITKLFPTIHPIRTPDNLTIYKLIEYITTGFSFNDKFYCVNHSIERSKGNFYAIFFITSHIYGLERMLSVKWQEDKEFGKGHRIKSPQLSLFDDEEKEEIKNNNYVWLASNLHDYIEEMNIISNLDLYKFTLTKGFLPKHSNQILKDWKNQSAIKVLNATTNVEILKPRSFHNNYNDYKSQIPKILIKFKSHGTI